MPGYNATYSFTSVVPWPAAGSGRHIARPTRGRPDAAEITVPLNVVTSVRPTDVILRAPRHPYARVLIGAVPPVDPARSGTRPRPSPRPDRSLGHRTQLTVGDRRGMARTLRQWSRDKPRRSIPGTRSQPDTRSHTRYPVTHPIPGHGHPKPRTAGLRPWPTDPCPGVSNMRCPDFMVPSRDWVSPHAVRGSSSARWRGWRVPFRILRFQPVARATVAEADR